MPPLRIVQYAGAGIMGGLLAHLVILTRGLREAGHEVDVVLSPSPGADPASRAAAAAGARVTRLTVAGKTDVAGMLSLRRLVKGASPDVFHLHLSSPVEAVPALLAARWGGARAVVTTEHAPTWHPLERIYSRAAKRAATRSIDAVIALSRADAAFLSERFGVPADLLHVIPNGVPDPGVAPARGAARARWGLTGDPLVGCVGELEIKKGVLDLLEAIAQAGLPSAGLAMAGEGSLREELSRRAGELPFPVHLPGRVDPIAGFLAALDIFAIASHQEAMPLSLLEAMWAGLPIVATRVGGIPEAVEDGSTGILVEPSRPGDLAAALRRLAGDATLARRLGEEARRAAERRFGAARMVREVEDLYAGILLAAADRKAAPR